jgi:hypothetical protein
MKSRLTRLEKVTRALSGGRCPVCYGRDSDGYNARIWFREGAAAPVLGGPSPCYDEAGHCVRCGARARDIVVCFPGVGPGAREEGD